MSSEHAFTKSILLEDWQVGDLTRTLPDGSPKTIPVSSAGRRVLCKRHNSALEPLDRVGRRFVAALRAQLEHAAVNSAVTKHALFNGYDVERWMLKVLCGLQHGRPVSRTVASPRWDVPDELARILFEGRPLPAGAGIYMPRVAYGRSPNGVQSAVIVGQRSDGELAVAGLSMTLYGHDFDLYLARPPEPTQFWYRTRMLRTLTQAGGSSYIHFGWTEHPPTFAGSVAYIDRANPRDDLLI